jgi:hypothetical protein
MAGETEEPAALLKTTKKFVVDPALKLGFIVESCLRRGRFLIGSV